MKTYIIIANGKEYTFTSKREVDKFYINSFLEGLSVYEKR